jgi:hypothetical protein
MLTAQIMMELSPVRVHRVFQAILTSNALTLTSVHCLMLVAIMLSAKILKDLTLVSVLKVPLLTLTQLFDA